MTPTTRIIEGATPSRVIDANIGNGFATYALVNDTWYSVNLYNGRVSDVRWEATTAERDQIIAILSSRLKRTSEAKETA